MLLLWEERNLPPSTPRTLCLLFAFCCMVSTVGWPAPPSMIAAERDESPGEDGRDYQPPLVWIICGIPGDETHDSLFTDVIRRLRETLHEHFLVSYEDIHVLYGSANPPYGILCDKPTLKSELQAISRQVEQNPRDVWLIFMGHANSLEGSVYYNLPGEDVTGRELGEFLEADSSQGHLAIVLTTAAAGRFAPYLAGSNRAILSATEPADPDNRTEFPLALVQTLQADATDANQDGWVDLLEVFQATRQRVDRIYEAHGWVKVEEATLDGDGNGRATRRPSFPDARGALAFRMRLSTRSSRETSPPQSDEQDKVP